jgi:hypothetical protein
MSTSWLCENSLTNIITFLTEIPKTVEHLITLASVHYLWRFCLRTIRHGGSLSNLLNPFEVAHRQCGQNTRIAWRNCSFFTFKSLLSWYRHYSERSLCAVTRDCTSSADNVSFVVPPILCILFLIFPQFVIFLSFSSYVLVLFFSSIPSCHKLYSLLCKLLLLLPFLIVILLLILFILPFLFLLLYIFDIFLFFSVLYYYCVYCYIV